ncbi:MULTISPECIES: hypothetical protein [Nocardia]|uniref:DUF222 domain-containing protein n=1 Tax=Nocardia aurea TaxID=2144174 RepID=A0ABV3FPZ0_9NOCA|nr:MULTISPECIES: hypothetical protein [Nocardia]
MPPQRRKGSIGGGSANPLADSAEHTPPVSPLRDAQWRRAEQPEPSNIGAEPVEIVVPAVEIPVEPPKTMVEPATALTMPLPETPGDGPLSDREQQQLSACESSIDSLRIAFWAAGRALQIVRDGRLYRSEHTTFDDYVEQRWDMQRSYAHKLIRAWPLAARLHPVAPAINEGQVRELLTVAAEHGEDAAVAVYTTLADDPEVKVTAGKLREAVAILPRHCGEVEVRQRVQAWLRGELGADNDGPAIDLFSTVESRLAALGRRVVKGSGEDPVAAREFAARLRSLAEQIEEQITA